MNNEHFIVFEGIDGSGKSTQAARLHAYLAEKGMDAVLLREPTDGPFGKEIRALLAGDSMPSAEKMSHLFIKDRFDDVVKNIRPALGEGQVVVMDRYYFSNAAYQGAMGLTWQEILEANQSQGFPVPGLVLYIHIDVDTALDRVTGRGGEREKEIFEKRSFLQQVYDNYHDMKDDSFAVIDGTGSEDQVALLVQEAVDNYFLGKT